MPTERETAVEILMEIERGQAYSGVALSRNLSRADWLDARGRGFVTETVNGCMRNLILLDYFINGASKTPVDQMEPFIRHTIRAAVYQIKFMDRVPAPAAVNEAVNSAKKHGFGPLAGFVNGVLRGVLRANAPLPGKSLGMAEYLSLRYSFPLWVAQYYIESFGPEKAEEICKASISPPSVHICANTLRSPRDKLAASMGAQPLGRNGAVLPKTSDITKLPQFRRGLFHVMDHSSMKAVEALDPQPGEIIFDLCAAPGGKSFYSAYLMNGKGKILAWDIHRHKIGLINESARRLGIEIIEAMAADARAFRPELAEKADRVLVDAPCSGLGVASRKPDIKYSRTMEGVLGLAALQREILSAAGRYVKPGGALVYATCTLTREENGGNAEWFKDNFPFALESEALILPGGSDGFYMAKFIKNKG